MFLAPLDASYTVGKELIYSDCIEYTDGIPLTFKWTVTGRESVTFAELGFEFLSDNPAEAEIIIDRISLGGTTDLKYEPLIPLKDRYNIPGWISSLDRIGIQFSTDKEPITHIGSNGERKFLVTGNRFWGDITVKCRFRIHAADEAGIVFRYQGAERYYSAYFTKNTLRIAKQYYSETILAEIPYTLEENIIVPVEIDVKGNSIFITVDGKRLLTAKDDTLKDGGAGFFADTGLLGFRDLSIKAVVK